MTDGCSSRVIGREVAAGLNMTIDGTAIAIGITVTRVRVMAAATAVVEDISRRHCLTTLGPWPSVVVQPLEPAAHLKMLTGRSIHAAL